jgi:A/G-specific adenine glycosylase
MLSACGELVLFLNCCGRDVIDVFRRRVVEWFRVCGDRELPWRVRSDGWAVLIAGVLLKRTTVKQVLKVYEEFLKRFPTPSALARASEDEVWLLLKPLGLRHRARQLTELARALVERFGGAIPCSFEELKSLPGVGSYTASEVMLRVCREPAPLLDTNTVRVVRRVFGIEPSRSNSYEDSTLLVLAKELTPKDPSEAEELAYGVMDLARKVCKARSPLCLECPVKDICKWFSTQKAQY